MDKETFDKRNIEEEIKGGRNILTFVIGDEIKDLGDFVWVTNGNADPV